jgi:hypothetical protein
MANGSRGTASGCSLDMPRGELRLILNPMADSPLHEKGRLQRGIGAAKHRQAWVLLDVGDRLPRGGDEATSDAISR